MGCQWIEPERLCREFQVFLKPTSAGANFHLSGEGYIDFTMNNFYFFPFKILKSHLLSSRYFDLHSPITFEGF